MIPPLRISRALVGPFVLIPILDAVNVERPTDARLKVDTFNVDAYTYPEIMLEFCIEDKLTVFEDRLEIDIVLAVIEDATKDETVTVLATIEDVVNCDSCEDREIILDAVKEDVFMELHSIVEPVNVEIPTTSAMIEDPTTDDTNMLLAKIVLAAKVDALREDIFAMFVVIVEPTSEERFTELTVIVDPVSEDIPS